LSLIETGKCRVPFYLFLLASALFKEHSSNEKALPGEHHVVRSRSKSRKQKTVYLQGIRGDVAKPSRGHAQAHTNLQVGNVHAIHTDCIEPL